MDLSASQDNKIPKYMTFAPSVASENVREPLMHASHLPSFLFLLLQLSFQLHLLLLALLLPPHSLLQQGGPLLSHVLLGLPILLEREESKANQTIAQGWPSPDTEHPTKKHLKPSRLYGTLAIAWGQEMCVFKWLRSDIIHRQSVLFFINVHCWHTAAFDTNWFHLILFHVSLLLFLPQPSIQPLSNTFPQLCLNYSQEPHFHDLHLSPDCSS